MRHLSPRCEQSVDDEHNVSVSISRVEHQPVCPARDHSSGKPFADWRGAHDGIAAELVRELAEFALDPEPRSLATASPQVGEGLQRPAEGFGPS